MIAFYKYIFCKSYFFCIRVFKEKDFPQIWAGSVLAFIIIINVIVLLELAEYMMLPHRINIYYDYHKYFAIVFWGLMLIYIHINKKYIRILEYCKTIPQKKKKVFRILSILYYLFLAISFFLMSHLLREYNISNHLR